MVQTLIVGLIVVAALFYSAGLLLPAALRGGERLAARPPPLHRSRWLWLWQSWCAWSCGGTSPGTGPLPFGPGPSPAPTPASSPPAGGRRRGARALRHRPLAHPLHPHPPRSANICAYMYFVVGASILASLLLCFTQVGACSLGSPPHRDAHPPATHPVHPAPPPPLQCWNERRGCNALELIINLLSVAWWIAAAVTTTGGGGGGAWGCVCMRSSAPSLPHARHLHSTHAHAPMRECSVWHRGQRRAPARAGGTHLCLLDELGGGGAVPVSEGVGGGGARERARVQSSVCAPEAQPPPPPPPCTRTHPA